MAGDHSAILRLPTRALASGSEWRPQLTHHGSALASIRKAEEEGLLCDGLRQLIQCCHLRIRQRCEVAGNLYILFELRDVVAADDDRADRM